MGTEVIGVSKTFEGGVRALVNVSLACADGQVTAVVGANGSGKSTLAKLLSGVYRPDSGLLRVGDVTTNGFQSPIAAAAAGIRIVHQEAPLVNLLSVAEVMALFSSYPTGLAGRVRWRELYRRACAQLETLGVPVDPHRTCASLSPAERAMVSLAIALGATGTRLLVLDEVTAPLTEREASSYLAWIRDLARKHSPVLMVTHRLAELSFADQVIVLREGRVVAVHGPGASEEEVVADIVGERSFLDRQRGLGRASQLGVAELWSDARRLPAFASPKRGHPLEPALEVKDLSGDVVRDLDLTLYRGEVLGVAGLRGSGVEELPYLLSGNKAWYKGAVRVVGKAMPEKATPAEARRIGIGFLPADRLNQGGVASLSVSTNIVLPEIRQFWHRPHKEQVAAEAVIQKLDVRPPVRKMTFGKLSGGNQQKVLLGKWLRLAPAVLILDDPTYGVDPGARRVLFDAVFEAAMAGVGVLLLSSEPEQLVAHCDRVLVMREGRLTHELRNDGTGEESLTLENLTTWAYA